MRRKLNTLLAAALVCVGFSCTPAFAFPNGGLVGHDSSHDVVPLLDHLYPYMCDTDGDLSDGDFNAVYANDSGHLVLRVNVFSSETNFICDNAGGVARLSHPIPFLNASALVKTTGGLVDNDVYLELVTDGDVFYFNTSDAHAGQTVNGYTLYTWKSSDFAGKSGFPSRPSTAKIGLGVYMEAIGTASMLNFAVNGHVIGRGGHTLAGCPWNAGQVCGR